MRVITGTARGVRLSTLEGNETRPTADRVKQAVFNILQFDIEGRSVLDLFAGSGQMGIEALSRGAVDCVFVDANTKAADIVRKNLKAAKQTDRARVVCGDSIDYCRRTADRFDVAFLDPPYASDCLARALPLVADRMRQGGTIVCETDAAQTLPERVGDFAVVGTRRYGKTQVWIYRHAERSQP